MRPRFKQTATNKFCRTSGINEMKSTYALRLLSLAGMAGMGCLTVTPSFAGEDSHPYIGVGAGRSWANVDDEAVGTTLLPAGSVTIRDETDWGFKLFGGYQFTRHLALEGGYFNLGEFGFSSTVVPTGTLNGEAKLHGLNLDLVGTWPFSNRWSAIGRVGAHYTDTRDTFTGTGSVVVFDREPEKREFNYKIGAGVQYSLDPVLLRLEGERYRVSDALSNHGDINTLMLSVVYPFGRPTPRPVEVAHVPPAPPVIVEPAPVVVAPPPPPPPPAPRRRVSFSADSLFAFNKSEIQPAGKADLEKFAQELKGTRFEVITVEGHTDRLGSPLYNEKLSVQRAEIVKAYLVDAGIDGAKVTAVGKGESTPVTKLDDCKGEKRTPQLIVCLQPDRRVEVEVDGTRAP
jgi:OmpA-OmpF porin, OOP family